MSQVYATPSNMWEMALPPDTLFNDQGIEAGAWSDPVFTGVGTGFLDVSLNSNPRSEFSVIVKCVKAGELNVYGFINPGSPLVLFSLWTMVCLLVNLTKLFPIEHARV